MPEHNSTANGGIGKLGDDMDAAGLKGDYVVNVTLVVKADTRDKAESHVARRLGAWFIEDLEHGAPYPQGSLLHWSCRRETL